MHGKIIGVPGILVFFRKPCLVDDGGNDLVRILVGMPTRVCYGVWMIFRIVGLAVEGASVPACSAPACCVVAVRSVLLPGGRGQQYWPIHIVFRRDHQRRGQSVAGGGRALLRRKGLTGEEFGRRCAGDAVGA